MNRPPVLVLGGAENVLSIARSLGRYGVTVRVAVKETAAVHASKFCDGCFSPQNDESFDDLLRRLLQRKELYGSVVLSCSDEAVEFVARNRDNYSGKFVFEENRPDIQLKLLDKQATIDLARSADIDAPDIYCGRDGISEIDFSKLRLPVLVKPIHSHKYCKVFDWKVKFVESTQQLQAHLDEVRKHNLEVMVCEFIPGPDDNLCSYYSYFEQDGSPLFHYTKSVIRRYPAGFGAGCYHMARCIPDAMKYGLRFFQRIGFVGLANVEFKLDPRDGRLKLIEANARFTAAQELLVRCGLDTARIVYDRLAGNPVRIPKKIATNTRLWYPRADFAAFRELHKRKRLSFRQWLASIAHRQIFPVFELCDPKPALAAASRTIRSAIGRRV